MNFRNKLALSLFLSTTIILSIFCLVLLFISYDNHRQKLLLDLQTLADVAADNSAGALSFGIAFDAKEVVDTLEQKKSIQFAALYTPDQKIFAVYQRNQDTPPEFDLDRNGHEYTEEGLILYREIRVNTKVVGFLIIHDDLSLLKRELENDLIGMGIVLAVSILVSYILALWLSPFLTRPLFSLTRTAREVSENHEYSVRVAKTSDDEIGQLIETFNDMLSQIEKRDHKLEALNRDLEDAVEQRTAELRIARDEAEAASTTKSEFLANMSHEIRTPMNAIMGFSDILKDKIHDPKAKYYLNAIATSGNSLLHLINDILDLSKVEAGKLELEYSYVNPYDLFKEFEPIFGQKFTNRVST